MRILHLVPTLGSGGAERQLYLLCRETKPRVDHYVCAASDEGRWAAPLRSLGIPVRNLQSALRDPRLVFRLRSAIRETAPDVVHCWLPSMNIAGAFAAGARPVVASVRNVDDWKSWVYRLADWAAAPFWNAVISNSAAGAVQIARSAGLAPEMVYVIPNGILARAGVAKSAESAQTVITACRLVPQKRVDRILDTARDLPGLRFRIAGAGPLRESLERAAAPNVEFLGELADPAPEFDRAGWFLLASEREGTSNALLEAMQAGCVPIVTAVGDNAAIVADGTAGRVVGGTAKEMTSALVESMKSWSKMSDAARECAARYSVPAMAERTLSVYRSLVHAAAANPLPRLH